MFFEAILLAVVIGAVTGGKVINLKNVYIRHGWLFILAFAVQLALNYLAGEKVIWVTAYKGYFHLFSYVLLFIGLLFNREVPGMKLLGLGVLLNFIVIAANQGLMPVSGTYLSPNLINELQAGGSGTHGLLTGQTNLGFLGDQIYLPMPYSRQMISIGDIVLDLGIIFMLVTAMKEKGDNFKFTYINRKL